MPNGRVDRSFTPGERDALLLRIQVLELEAAKDRRVPMYLPWLLGALGTALATASALLPPGGSWQVTISALSAGVASFSSAVALASRGTK